MATASSSNAGTPYKRHRLHRHLPSNYRHFIAEEEARFLNNIHELLEAATGFSAKQIHTSEARLLVEEVEHSTRSSPRDDGRPSSQDDRTSASGSGGGTSRVDEQDVNIAMSEDKAFTTEMHQGKLKAACSKIETFLDLKYTLSRGDLLSVLRQLFCATFNATVNPQTQQRCMRTLLTVLKKQKSESSRIRISWRCLYEKMVNSYLTHVESGCCSSKEVTSSHLNALQRLLKKARHYFPPTAAAEIVEELEKSLVLAADSPKSQSALIFLFLLLPSSISLADFRDRNEIISKLFRLWARDEHSYSLDALWASILHRFAKNSRARISGNLAGEALIFKPSQVEYEYDWSPYVPFIVSRLRENLMLPSPQTPKLESGLNRGVEHLCGGCGCPDPIKALVKLVVALIKRCPGRDFHLNLPDSTGANGTDGEVAEADVIGFIEMLASECLTPCCAGDGSSMSVIRMLNIILEQVCKRLGQEAANRRHPNEGSGVCCISCARDLREFTSVTNIAALHFSARDVHRLVELSCRLVRESMFSNNLMNALNATRCFRLLSCISPRRASSLLVELVEEGLFDPDAMHTPLKPLSAIASVATNIAFLMYPRPWIGAHVGRIFDQVLNQLNGSDARKTGIALLAFSRLFTNVSLQDSGDCAVEPETCNIDSIVQHLSHSHPDKSLLTLSSSGPVGDPQQSEFPLPFDELRYSFPIGCASEVSFQDFIDKLSSGVTDFDSRSSLVEYWRHEPPLLPVVIDGMPISANHSEESTEIISSLYKSCWEGGSRSGAGTLVNLALKFLDKALYILTVAEGKKCKSVSESESSREKAKTFHAISSSFAPELGESVVAAFVSNFEGLNSHQSLGPSIVECLAVMLDASNDRVKSNMATRFVEWILQRSASEGNHSMIKAVSLFSRKCAGYVIENVFRPVCSKIWEGVGGRDDTSRLTSGVVLSLEWNLWVADAVVDGLGEYAVNVIDDCKKLLDKFLFCGIQPLRQKANKLLRHLLRSLSTVQLAGGHGNFTNEELNQDYLFLRWSEPQPWGTLQTSWMIPGETMWKSILNTLADYLRYSGLLLRSTLKEECAKCSSSAKDLLPLIGDVEVGESPVRNELTTSSELICAAMATIRSAYRGISSRLADSIDTMGDDSVLAHGSACESPIGNISGAQRLLLDLCNGLSPTAAGVMTGRRHTSLRNESVVTTSSHVLAGVKTSLEYLTLVTLCALNRVRSLQLDGNALKSIVKLAKNVLTNKGIDNEKQFRYSVVVSMAKSTTSHRLFKAYVAQLQRIRDSSRPGTASDSVVGSSASSRQSFFGNLTADVWYGRAHLLRKLGAYHCFRLKCAASLIPKEQYYCTHPVSTREPTGMQTTLAPWYSILKNVYGEGDADALCKHCLLKSGDELVANSNVWRTLLLTELAVLNRSSLEEVHSKVFGILSPLTFILPWLKSPLSFAAGHQLKQATSSLEALTESENNFQSKETLWGVARGSLSLLQHPHIAGSKVVSNKRLAVEFTSAFLTCERLGRVCPPGKTEDVTHRVSSLVTELSKVWQPLVSSPEDSTDAVLKIVSLIKEFLYPSDTEAVISESCPLAEGGTSVAQPPLSGSPRHWRYQLLCSSILAALAGVYSYGPFSKSYFTVLRSNNGEKEKTLRDWVWSWWMTLCLSSVVPLRHLALQQLATLLYVEQFGERDTEHESSLSTNAIIPEVCTEYLGRKEYLSQLIGSILADHKSAYEGDGSSQAQDLWSGGVAEAVGIVAPAEFRLGSFGSKGSSDFNRSHFYLLSRILEVVPDDSLFVGLLSDVASRSNEEDRRASVATVAEMLAAYLHRWSLEAAKSFETTDATHSGLFSLIYRQPHEAYTDDELTKLSSPDYLRHECSAILPFERMLDVLHIAVPVMEEIPLDWTIDFQDALQCATVDRTVAHVLPVVAVCVEKIGSQLRSDMDSESSGNTSSFAQQVKWMRLLPVLFEGVRDHQVFYPHPLGIATVSRKPGKIVTNPLSLYPTPLSLKDQHDVVTLSGQGQARSVQLSLWRMLQSSWSNRYKACREMIGRWSGLILGVFATVQDGPRLGIRCDVLESRAGMWHNLVIPPQREVWTRDCVLPLVEKVANASTTIRSFLGNDGGDSRPGDEATDSVTQEAFEEATRVMETFCCCLATVAVFPGSIASSVQLLFLPTLINTQNHPRPEIKELLNGTLSKTVAELRLAKPHIHDTLENFLCFPDKVKGSSMDQLADFPFLFLRDTLKEASNSNSWHTKCYAIHAAATILFYHHLSSKKGQQQILFEFLIQSLADAQIKAREAAGSALRKIIPTLSGSEQSQLAQRLLKHATSKMAPKPNQKETSESQTKYEKSLRRRHAGILGLGAIIRSHPFDVPPFLPEILAIVVGRASDPEPVGTEAKAIVTSFKETHHSEWHNRHSVKFSSDQLDALSQIGEELSYFA
eukprot:gb/GECG01011690.1/.p1 GENE.gb/GECG01011690.1/~~gb/GECG01011690.1/.p1  ORF type:complete len:2423 (+),score=249.59 gb/GECG01011690.1/:1-7269(+)